MSIDSFHVKFGSSDSGGFMQARVRITFAGDDPLTAPAVQVDVQLPEQPDATLRELREQARLASVQWLQQALVAIQDTTAEQLHRQMLDREAAERAREMAAIHDAAQFPLDQFQS